MNTRPMGHVVLTMILSCACVLQAGVPTTSPVLENGEVVLFDAARDGPDVFRNYTASWIKGSDLVPVTRRVARGGETFVEFSYEKNEGTAISLVRFENIPPPAEGSRYSGIELFIDYDGADYSNVSVQSHFADDTAVTTRLTLERGTNVYRISEGFRRAGFPPEWSRLSWVWLSVDSSLRGFDKNVVYRLKRIILAREEVKSTASTTVAFGDRVFCPEPKQIIWKEGELAARAQTDIHLPADASARSQKTADLFCKEYSQNTGTGLRLNKYDGETPAEGVVLRIAESVVFGGARTKLRPEGYCLAVEPRRVVITGADERGLYYGGVTFFQLLKNSMRVEDPMPVPCVEILDWPDMRNRLCRLEHPHHFKNRPLKENRGIDFLIDWTDRFVAGNKLNVLFIDFSALIIYERRPEFNGSERIYSLKDLERFGEFCRDHFIDLCPAWQIGGHANWWLTYGYHPELIEKGWGIAQGDVTHPDHDPIVYDCMLDAIEALKPKYVSPKSDEWWHTRKPDEPLDDLLHGKTRAEAFLDFHVKLNKWLNDRGITMMMYHDMLTPFHNGKRFDVYKIVDKMPKNIVVLHWNAPDDIPKWFAKKGFTVWMNPTGMRLIPKEMETLVTGCGKGLYSFGDSKKIPSELKDTSNMYALHRAADHAWNLSRDARESWRDDVASGRLVAVRNLFAVRPNPRAGAKIRPLDIRARMNQSFADFLRQAKPDVYTKDERPVRMSGGETEIGFVPTLLGPEDGNNCIVVKKGDPETPLAIQGRLSSLIFLHTASIRSRYGIKPTTYREWPYGFPCGDYVVRYEDGAELVLPIRFEYNIRRFDVPSINRTTNDNRYVHRLEDSNGSDVFLCQWEWVNPRPDKWIVEVVARHDNELDVSLMLFAVSGRDIFPRNP